MNTEIFCPKCEKRGYQYYLGSKILMPGQVRDEDYENWLECPRCCQVIPIYEGLKEETVSNTIETVESPFESKFIVESLPNRNKGKKIAVRGKKRRKDRMMDEGPEINDLLRIYGDRVNVLK